MTQLWLLRAGIYIVDTSSLVELDNKHFVLPGQAPRPPSFDLREQALVWDGLEALARSGRLEADPPCQSGVGSLESGSFESAEGLPGPPSAE